MVVVIMALEMTDDAAAAIAVQSPGAGGKRMPPGTAPKPYGAGGPGAYGDERGHPAELYNQAYQQQQRAPGCYQIIVFCHHCAYFF